MKTRFLFFLFLHALIFSSLMGQTTTLSVDTQVGAANVTQGTIKHAIFHFHLDRDIAGSISLTSITFLTTGSYTASDLTRMQLWANTKDEIGTSVQVGNDLTINLGPGIQTIGGFSHFLSPGKTAFFWITADFALYAAIGNTIQVKNWTTGNFTVSSGAKIGSAAESKAQTITAFASLGTDYFRSQGSGNWGTPATWQSSHDNINWANATLSPTNTANTVTIMTGHTVTVAASVNVDQVIVNGKMSILNAVTLDVVNGTGIDLTINGIMEKTGSGAVNTSAGAGTFFSSGSIYEHLNTDSAGTIPIATWDIHSSCVISGYTTNVDTPTGLNQAFGNFMWNCPNQTGNINANGELFVINGNFIVASTGTGTLHLTSSSDCHLTIGLDLAINDGTLSLTSSYGKPELDVFGDLVQMGGILDVNRNISGTWNVTTIRLYRSFYQLAGTITKTVSATAYYGDIVLIAESGQFEYRQSGTISDKVRITKNGAAVMNLISNVSWPSKVTISDGTLDFGTTARTMTLSAETDSIDFSGSSLLLNGGNVSHGIIYTGATSVITFPASFTHGTEDYFEFANAYGTQVINQAVDFNHLRINAGATANVVLSNDTESRVFIVAGSLDVMQGSLTVTGSGSSGLNRMVCEGRYRQTGGIFVLCGSATASTELYLKHSFTLLGGSFKKTPQELQQCFLTKKGPSFS